MDNNGRFFANNDRCYEECRRRRCNGIYHVIKQGETLYGLSRQYRVSVDAIIRANPGVNIYNLRINDELCIPVMTRPMPVNPMPGRPMPRTEMPMNNNMPLDFTFEFDDDGAEFEILDDDMVETESRRMNNYFSENDSVKDMLEKTGMTMAELLDCINRR